MTYAFTVPVAIAAALCAGAAHAASLTVDISGLASDDGEVAVALFHGAENYENNQPADGARVTIENGVAQVTFENVEPGRYGMKLYHDVNGDGELNANAFGIPREPFAFSNSAQGRFGPAPFDDAGFDVTEGDNTHALSF